MKTHVLDSSALLTLLFDSPGAADVKNLIKMAGQAGSKLAMSTVQLGEVFHVVKNRPNHQETLNSIRRLEEVVEFVPLTVELAEKAADVRRETGLYFADSVAAALTKDRDGVLVTSDSDFKRTERKITIKWIGKN